MEYGHPFLLTAEEGAEGLSEGDLAEQRKSCLPIYAFGRSLSFCCASSSVLLPHVATTSSETSGTKGHARYEAQLEKLWRRRIQFVR